MKFFTSCGGCIVIPYKTQKHLRAHPEVWEILPEVFDNISLPQDSKFLTTEVEMRRIIGLSKCVKAPQINIDDRAFFAQRVERKGPSRVILEKGVETTKVVVIAHPSSKDKGTYFLVTSWIGILAEKEPGDKSITSILNFQKSLDFWTSNALIYESEVMGDMFESSWGEILKDSKFLKQTDNI